MKKKQTFELDIKEVCEAMVSYIAWTNGIDSNEHVGAVSMHYTGPDLSGVRIEFLAIEDLEDV